MPCVPGLTFGRLDLCNMLFLCSLPHIFYLSLLHCLNKEKCHKIISKSLWEFTYWYESSWFVEKKISVFPKMLLFFETPIRLFRVLCSGLDVALLLTLVRTFFTVGWRSHFPSPVTPACDTPSPMKKKVESYAFSPRLYQEKSLPCGCGGTKTEGSESPPAILGCVLKIAVLRERGRKKETEGKLCER